jgi:GAF domain-containing protein
VRLEQSALDAVLDVVCQIGPAAISQPDLPALLEFVCRATNRIIAADCSAVGLHDPVEQGLRFEAFNKAGKRQPAVLLRQAEGWGLAGRVFEQQTSLLCPDLSTDDLTSEALPLGETPRCFLGVPLRVEQAAFGVLAVQSTTAEAFTPTDKRVLEAIASQAAAAIADQEYHRAHERRIAQLSVLGEIARALSAALELDPLLQTVYQETSRVVDTTNFYVAFYDPQQDEVSFPLAIEAGQQVRWQSRQAGKGLTEYVLNRRAPLLIHRDVSGTLEQLGVEMIGSTAVSWLGVPLMIADRVLGIMAVQSYTPGEMYDDQDQSLLTTIAAHTAVAIENARLYEQARLQAQEMATLFTVSRTLAASAEPEATWKRVFEAVRWAVPYEGIEACLYDERENRLQAVMGGGLENLSPIEGESYVPGEGYTGWIAQNRVPLRIADVREEVDLRPKIAHFAGVEVRSYLGVPMILGDRLVGTLEITSSQAGQYSEHHEDLLLAVASQAAAAVERSQLLTAARAHAREMAALNELGQALTTYRTVDQVVEEAYRQAGRLLDTTNFYVALYDAAQDQITFVLDAIEGELRKPHSTRKAGRGLTEHVIRTGQPLLIPESVGERLAELGIEAIGSEARSWLGVPLHMADRVLGVIAVQSYTTPRLYGEHERDLLSAIASQAVIALENAALFEETQRALAEVREANERQRQLLDVVRELSTPLVPIAEGILVLPLVGTVDSRRAQQILDVLLSGVTDRRAKVVIMDITGVPVVDTSVANYLLQATQAVRLLGAECILVGITPEVAQTVVGLGVDLRRLSTRSDLQSGVEHALRLLQRKRFA